MGEAVVTCPTSQPIMQTSFWQRFCYSVEVLKKWACHFSSDLYFSGREQDKKPLEIHIWYLQAMVSLGLCNQWDWENEGEGRLAECETGPGRGGLVVRPGRCVGGVWVASDFQGFCLLIWSTSHGYLCGNEQPLSPGTFTEVLALLQLSADMSWWDIAAWINQHSMHNIFFSLKKKAF